MRPWARQRNALRKGRALNIIEFSRWPSRSRRRSKRRRRNRQAAPASERGSIWELARASASPSCQGGPTKPCVCPGMTTCSESQLCSHCRTRSDLGSALVSCQEPAQVAAWELAQVSDQEPAQVCDGASARASDWETAKRRVANPGSVRRAGQNERQQKACGGGRVRRGGFPGIVGLRNDGS